jgi:Tol biopolymer transport system component
MTLFNIFPSSVPQTLRTALLTALLLPGAQASAGQTVRCDLGAHGSQQGGGLAAVLSGNGEFLTFTSDASGLVANDTNNAADVFVHSLHSGATRRVSVGLDGSEANGDSNLSSLSGDGRYVVFESGASNLVPGDNNGFTDTFVYDRDSGLTERVNIASDGAEANAASSLAAISPDGRFVAFSSTATNLVQNDGNGDAADIFVHDRETHETTRIKSSSGVESDGQDEYPAISRGGRFVTFTSDATNLVPGDSNGVLDIFVHDRKTGLTTRVSVASDGAEANGSSLISTISHDGRYVAFTSAASNLVPNDTNNTWDAFIHDRTTGHTLRASVASNGEQGNGGSELPVMSADGQIIAFVSQASNLVAGDNNGKSDIYAHNLSTGRTTRLSNGVDGQEANGDSDYPSISDNGWRVAFESSATNLAANDTNNNIDVFLIDRRLQPNLAGVCKDAVKP